MLILAVDIRLTFYIQIHTLNLIKILPTSVYIMYMYYIHLPNHLWSINKYLIYFCY